MAFNLKEIQPLPVFEYQEIQKFYPKPDENIFSISDIDTTQQNIPLPHFSEPIEEEKVTMKHKSAGSKELKVSHKTNRTKLTNKNETEENKHEGYLQISIPKFETISQGWYGIKSYTQYKIITISQNIPLLGSEEYTVWRRFSDFEWLHNSLISINSFEGVVFPKLPEKPYLARQDEVFLDARRSALQGYLKILVEHPGLRVSQPIHQFLTERDEDKFTKIKQQDTSTFQNRLYEYALQVKNFDMDRFVTNIGQYFDSEEPNKFAMLKEK